MFMRLPWDRPLSIAAGDLFYGKAQSRSRIGLSNAWVVSAITRRSLYHNTASPNVSSRQVTYRWRIRLSLAYAYGES